MLEVDFPRRVFAGSALRADADGRSLPAGKVRARSESERGAAEANHGDLQGVLQEGVRPSRERAKKAEAELQAAFDESPVDQHKSNDAIEHLAAARVGAVSRNLANGSENPHGADRRAVAGIEEAGTPRRSGQTGRTRSGWRRGGPSTKAAPPTGQRQQQKSLS